jgi:hypothetical protein
MTRYTIILIAVPFPSNCSPASISRASRSRSSPGVGGRLEE